ncbi:aggregation-promoting factor C-terminal-like domain-containing protein [Enterococcus dongliensis]|uniref:aggregation-promoting factor C-terminal-like domain-containing protein n=1 Tax=Enterococcus dongliensis TaxID=2559925 RepID=UPI0028907D3F|nr:tape measure protein [Enterococcus dongliensis]MDT2675052.1 tape measure protein [Enterococcus dongliensis]
MAGKGKPIGNIKLGISLDGTSFGNTLDEINAKVKQAESNMKANLKAYDSAGRSYEALSQKTKDLSTVMDGQNAKVKELTKRRDEAVGKYGEESKEVAKLNTQINNATAKYNAYGKQLNDTKKELVYSQTAVNDLTDEIKDNERQMNAEVKALKSAGDEAGAFEAKQKGLTKQAELSERAMDEQRKVVKLMADEFGDSADETEDARKELNKLERQSKLSDKQLEGLKNSADSAGREIDDFGDNAERSSRKMDGFKDKIGSLKSSLSFGAAAGVASNLIGRVVDGVMDLKDEAFAASDSLDKFTQTMQFAGIDNSKIKESQKVMKEYADQTVYDLGDVMNTTAQLAANGVEDFNGLTQAIGNVNAVSGGNAETFKSVATAMTQTIGTGKLTTENFNQISDAIPGASGKIQAALKEMGAYAGGDFRQAMADGEISAEELNTAFMKLGMTDVAKKAAGSTKTIEGAVGNLQAGVVNMINEIIGALGKGNITSFIDGITKGVDNLTKKIGPAIKGAANAIKPLHDGFKSLFGLFSNDTKKQTGGLDFIRKILPAEQAQTAISTINRIKDVISTLFSAFKNKDESVIYKLGLSPETVTTVQRVIGSIQQYIKGFTDNFKNMFTVAIEIAKGVFNTLSPYILPIISKIGSALGDIGKSMSVFWEQNGKQIIQAIKNFFVFIQPVVKIVMTLMMSFIDNVIGLVKGLLNAVQGAIKIFTGIFTGDFSKMWEGVKQLFSGAIQAVWNFIQIMFFKRLLQGVKGLATGFKTAVKGLWDGARNLFQQGINGVGSAVVNWISTTLGRVGGLRTSFVNAIKALWNSIKSLFSGGISNTWNAIRSWASNLLSSVGNLKNNLINVIKSLWNTIKNTFSSGISTVVNWMKALPGKIANGIKAGAGAVKNAFESIFKSAMNAVKKPINLIIDGASWVLEKLGGDKIKHWNPGYAQGTDGHPGGMMTVNDGAGAEMVVRPNGQAFIPQGKNITMYGEPGTQVIPAHDTAMLMGKKRSTFAYAKGTGGMFSNLWSNVKDVGSGILDSVKNAIGDVMDYIDDPGKLVSKLLGSNLLGGLTKWPLDVGGGILKKAKDALTSKVKEMFDSMSSGSFDGAMNANGVYQYLVDVAKKVMAKFPGLYPTSGYRPGDIYHHGRHQAIDISGYPVGSPRYTEAANYAFEKFPRDVGYVITNGRVRDRIGFSGTGVHDGWATWPAGDHFDHVHISGSKGAGEIYSGGSNSSGKNPKPSGGHENWMRMAGFKPSEYGAINYIVNHESSWNPSATNPSSGAYGLPQSLPASKLASAGSDWRTNPITQLKWMRNYVNERYGGANGALSFWKRNHWYANGGIVNQHQIAEIAEGNKPEIIIPLDSAKRSRAMQLLGIAMDKLGVQPKPSAANSNSSSSMETLVALMIQQNNLLAKLLAKDTNVILDSGEIAGSTNNHLGKRFDQALYTAG